MLKKGELILNSPTEAAIHSMEGKVWSCSVPHSQIDKMSQHFRVVNLHHNGDAGTILRIVSDTAPDKDAKRVEPSLEDLYLYHFEEVAREAQKL